MSKGAPVIVGAGPAGAAAAIHLARHGCRPLLLERTREDADALCGGFLSWRTLERLAALDIDAATLGGPPINHIAIFAGGRCVRAALPGSCMGVSRRRLDSLLRARAEAAGAILRRGVAVRTAQAGRLLLADGEGINADTLFLATGKRDLRGLPRDHPPAADPEIGLRLRLPPDPARNRAIGGAIELHLFTRGYLGLLVQEDGHANACMAVRKSLLRRGGGSAHGLLAMLASQEDGLAQRLAGAEIVAADAIGPVPYGWIARDTPPGLFRIGDQAACIPSLAGEGIGIALASAEGAAMAWKAQGREGAGVYQRRLARTARRPIATAGLARNLATSAALPPSLVPFALRIPGLAALLVRLTRI